MKKLNLSSLLELTLVGAQIPAERQDLAQILQLMVLILSHMPVLVNELAEEKTLPIPITQAAESQAPSKVATVANHNEAVAEKDLEATVSLPLVQLTLPSANLCRKKL
jgi:hypothetical protein